jgi:predicted ester cyclase
MSTVADRSPRRRWTKVLVAGQCPGAEVGFKLDLQPNGRSVRVDEIVIFRIANGKIVEAWEVYDECSMRRQLGSPQ